MVVYNIWMRNSSVAMEPTKKRQKKEIIQIVFHVM
jgi:hypothetical protein